MDAFWTLLIILVVFFFVLVILPNILPVSEHANAPPVRLQGHPSSPTEPVLTQQQIDKLENVASKQMLDQQFAAVNDAVPVNYPKKQIGACPYTKAPSTDLPLANTPMCISVQTHDMRLSSKLGSCGSK